MSFIIKDVYRNRIIKIENTETKRVYKWMKLECGNILLICKSVLVHDQFLKNIITDVCENYLQQTLKVYNNEY